MAPQVRERHIVDQKTKWEANETDITLHKWLKMLDQRERG